MQGFLRLEGVPGESTVPGHVGEMEIESFRWRESQASSGTTGTTTTSKVAMQDVTFTKLLDKSSPLLMLRCAAGALMKEAVFMVVVPSGSSTIEILRLTLSDVLIASYAIDGVMDGSSSAPTEEFSLTFRKIVFQYVPRGPAGPEAPVRTGWDKVGNKALERG